MIRLTETNRLVLAGMFVAMGILLPMFTAHAFGAGPVFLPMHIPVLLAGLTIGAKWGLIVGVVTPLLSSLLTGMPATFPMLPIMMGELGTYGMISGLAFNKVNNSKIVAKTYISMIIAMSSGRIVYGIILSALIILNAQPVLGAAAITAVPASVLAAVATGTPGIIIQLVFVPAIVVGLFRFIQSAKTIDTAALPAELEKAKADIKIGKHTCIVMRDGVIVREAKGRGVSPIVQFLENEPNILKNSEVADKVIGKAAAMLLVIAGAKYVYGELMSVSGRDFLEKHGVALSYGRCIDVISNRTGNGICPLEKSVMEIDDPHEGYERLKVTIAQLMSAQ